MTEKTSHPSICRFCTTACPVVVEIDDGRVVRVTGNKESPSYYGFCCTRGQAVPEQLHHPDRLITSMKRDADGAYVPIASETALDELAARIRELVDAFGPDSVAAYMGTYTNVCAPTVPFMVGFLRSLGTSMIFSANSIDQPGKDVAAALIGGWEAGPHVFGESDVWMILGGNALVSIAVTLPGQNPAKRLTDALNRGMKLIVIDPRRTQTAKRAHVHLQPRPGEDATIVAGIIRLIIAHGLHDADFVAANVDGFEVLRAAVEPFTPTYVAERADIPEDDLIAAALTFGQARRGIAVGATGVNMSGRSSLTEYLILALNTICGRFVREGETISNPGVLLPRATPKAQPRPPRPARNLGPALSTRGLAMAVSGMPTAALADEIMTGRIKALISVGGNPMAAWPDQRRTVAALEKLELFATVDIKMSASAKVADYVIAAKVGFEVPTASYLKESMELYSAVAGAPEPFGMYAPALIEPPAGSDLLEEWEFFYGLAQRLGLGLRITFANKAPGTSRERRKPVDIDMEVKPTTDELLEILTNGSRIPLSEVKRHPNGTLFPEDILVQPKSPDCTARMNVGNDDIMQELEEVLSDPIVALRSGPDFPFLMISRRLGHVYNSSGRDLSMLIRKGGTYNPAAMHPEDMRQLGLADGDEVVVESHHGSVRAIAEADDTLRKGVISMSHAFGDLPSENIDIRKVGTNSGALISVEDDYDRYSGIPRMSALPVRVKHASAG
jgi:anaerobic selenocysteine-containing dehydrogenase